VIAELAAQIETFGRYGFNKSHSVAYSIISLQTAWLKCHYPADFMAALLSSAIGDTDSVVKFINESRELGLEVLPPDVNESGYKFTVIGERKMRFGLGAIRNVGRGAIDSIIAARKDRPIESVFDLAERVDLRLCNKRVFEALVHSGALDGLKGHRAQHLAVLDTAIQEAGLKAEEREIGQTSLFGEPAVADGKGDVGDSGRALPSLAPLSESERLTKEKEILGFYISGHPLEPFRAECELFATHSVAQLGKWEERSISIGAVVPAIKKQVSKRTGAEFARLTVEDFSGSSEILVFPEAWAALSQRVLTDVPMLIKGGYPRRDQGLDNPTFIVETVQRFEELRVSGQVAVSIELAPSLPVTDDQSTPSADLMPDVFKDVRAVLDAHPGSAPVEVRWNDKTGSTARLRSRTLKVAANGAALAELRALLGPARVKLVRVG
jgi:DNA polymerase III subunit alpha